MDHTQYYAEFCHNLKYESIPEQTVNNIKLLIADYIASAIAGYRINREFNNAVENFKP